MCLISHLKPISRCINYLKVSVYPISKAIVNVEFLFFLKKIFFQNFATSQKSLS